MLEAVTDIGQNALHFAAVAGQERVIEQLLAICPELIERADSNGLTPLHIAAKAGHEKVVAQLLAHRPDLVTALTSYREQSERACFFFSLPEKRRAGIFQIFQKNNPLRQK